jgi:hypothetical protein
MIFITPNGYRFRTSLRDKVDGEPGTGEPLDLTINRYRIGLKVGNFDYLWGARWLLGPTALSEAAAELDRLIDRAASQGLILRSASAIAWFDREGYAGTQVMHPSTVGHEEWTNCLAAEGIS